MLFANFAVLSVLARNQPLISESRVSRKDAKYRKARKTGYHERTLNQHQ
jgi:hypothetical protein